MINLLPPAEKAAISQEENWKIVITYGITLVSFLISFGLILLAINFYISGQVENQKSYTKKTEQGTQTAEKKDMLEKSAQLNKTFAGLYTFYQKQPVFSELIEKVSRSLPFDIYLTNLSIAASPGWRAVFTISGYSPTRESLLSLKNNLESQEDIGEIIFPPSSWVKPADINFNVSFKIK